MLITGRCEPCDEEYFKPEANSENLCKRKSRYVHN